MSKIKVMSEALANKIAAGEVVERCSSVVKELVENSIDAKSKNIKIELTDGGLKKISVVDDGIGMDSDDAKLAFLPHATSKIYRDDDLFFIGTLGFRGEALPSIASVSDVTLKTCASSVGTEIHIKGGKVLETKPSDARIGTSITIQSLFYNTPARLKYLKSESTELSHSISLIEKLALAHPSICFTLKNNEKVIVKTTGSGDLLKTIHEIYGLKISSNMLKIDASTDDFHIYGYISKPIIQKNNRADMITFVNERLVKNQELLKAINDGYYLYKPVDKYPVVILNIEVDPTLTDVNIHPTKQDIKLSKIKDLTDLIYKTIKNTLYQTLLIPTNEEIESKEQDYQELESNIKEPITENINQVSLNFGDEKEIIKNETIKKKKLDFIGVIHRTFIVASDEEGMYLIDQHAMHERINYERNMKALEAKEQFSTKLLVPYVIEMTPSNYELFKQRSDDFLSLGFKYEEFGINTISINEYPNWLTDGYKEEMPEKVIDILLQDKVFNKEKFQETTIKMLSCKSSIRANEEVSQEVLEYLMEELFKCDNPYTCCHGRPTIIKYSNYELDKMFKSVES